MGRGESHGPFILLHAVNRAPCGRCLARGIISDMAEILLITSDDMIARQIGDHFAPRHLKLKHESDIATAMMAIAVRQFPLIILDTDLDGQELKLLIDEMRQQSKAPVFLISARTSEADVIMALDAGADDVFAKPIRPGELAAKAGAVLRRQVIYGLKEQRVGEYIEAREIYADLEQRRVWVRGKEKRFTRREYELLIFLMRHPDQVFTKEELYRRVWGEEVVGDMATVTVHIKKLRNMIEEKPAYPTIIGTDWGVGYVFLGKAPEW